MRSDWIMDVLADLRTFAQSNDLPLLAEQLDDAALVALAEIAARHAKTDGKVHESNTAGGDHFSGIGAS